MTEIVLVELNKKELLILQNDLISYIWKLEDKGLDKNNEYGYQSRKELLDKIKNIYIDNFIDTDCCSERDDWDD